MKLNLKYAFTFLVAVRSWSSELMREVSLDWKKRNKVEFCIACVTA